MNPIAAIKRFVARHIVADVPPELGACESCRELHCDERMASTCKLRLESIQGPAPAAINVCSRLNSTAGAGSLPRKEIP